MYSLSTELARSCVQVYTDEFMAFLILSNSHRSDSEALERYIDFYETAEAVKLLYQKAVWSLRIIFIKIENIKNWFSTNPDFVCVTI